MKHGWEYKKLGEVCTIERGGSPRPISAYITNAPDGINWIKIGDAVEGSKYISATKEKIRVEGMKKSRFVHKGDFILSNSMSFGKPYILGVDGCIHDGWLVIHDDYNTFNKDYLYYYLSSPSMYRKFESLAVGGVVNNLNSQLVRNVTVAIPPIQEQEAICSLLDKLSLVIEKKKQQLKELDNLAQAIFYDMFGDPVENEKGWEVKKLKDVGSIITGSTPSTSNSDNYASNDICFVKPSDIEKEGITTIKSTEFYVSNYAYDTVCRKLPKGSVLTTCIGIIGKVGVLSIDATCNQQINAVIPNPSMSSTYLAYAILSIRDYIQNVANAPVVPIINKGQFSSFQIPSPPLPLQQSFAQKVESIERQKELINQSIREAQTLFDSRMEYYFGE